MGVWRLDVRRGGGFIANRYNFDLPDSDFFFPGDVIHYYIEAKDNLAGDVGVALLPADTTGFGEFEGVWPYGGNSTFIVRALPTLFDAAGNQPPILFWNDFANRGGENEWYCALGNLGYREQIDYDVYYTNGPSSGVGNGLGGRATPQTSRLRHCSTPAAILAPHAPTGTTTTTPPTTSAC